MCSPTQHLPSSSSTPEDPISRPKLQSKRYGALWMRDRHTLRLEVPNQRTCLLVGKSTAEPKMTTSARRQQPHRPGVKNTKVDKVYIHRIELACNFHTMRTNASNRPRIPDIIWSQQDHKDRLARGHALQARSRMLFEIARGHEL